MPPVMTNRERILAASRSQPCDRLPFFHYWRHCQVGWAEREARNRGMGMCWVRPPYVEILHDIRVTEEYTTLEGRPVVRRTIYSRSALFRRLNSASRDVSVACKPFLARQHPLAGGTPDKNAR